MSGSPKGNGTIKSPKLDLITVKKFAVLSVLLCCFFLSGLFVGYYAFFRKIDKVLCPTKNRNDIFDDDHDTVLGIDPDKIPEINTFNRYSGDVPDFLIKPHLLSDHSTNDIRETFDLSEKEEISIHRYRTSIPRYDRNKKSFINFYSDDDELLTRETLSGMTLLNLFHGNVKARVILIEGRERLEDLNISLVKGAMVLTTIDLFSLDKARFFESIGVKALLFYEGRSLPDCQSNNTYMDEKPFWWFTDASTPGYTASEVVYRIPPLKWNLPKIPIVILPCQVVHDIMPYLSVNKDILGELEVTSRLGNITASNLMVSFNGEGEPDLSIMIGASRNNLIGTRRFVRILRSFSSSVNNPHWGWTPTFTTTFASWDSMGYGMSEFFEAYRSLWKEKIVLYIDLDHHEADNGHNHLMTSSSLENFARTILEQTSTNFNIRRLKNSGLCFPLGFPGLTFEKEIGVPFIKSFTSVANDEAQTLKLLGALVFSAAQTSPVEISLLKTMGEMSRSIKSLIQFYPVLKGHTFGMSNVLQKVRTSLESFENSLRESSNPSLSRIKMSNIMKVKIENTLRLSLHRLKYLMENPTAKFLQANNSHIGSQVYVNIFRNFFENEIIYQCPDRSNSFASCILYELSVIISRLHDMMKLLG